MGAGRVAQRLKMPQITGYVLGGLLCGPSFLTLFTSEALEGLIAVDQGCLAIIALSAGAEVLFGDLKRIQRQVLPVPLPSQPTTTALPVQRASALLLPPATWLSSCKGALCCCTKPCYCRPQLAGPGFLSEVLIIFQFTPCRIASPEAPAVQHRTCRRHMKAAASCDMSQGFPDPSPVPTDKCLDPVTDATCGS